MSGQSVRMRSPPGHTGEAAVREKLDQQEGEVKAVVNKAKGKSFQCIHVFKDQCKSHTR